MPDPIKIGYLAADGHPHVKIRVWGLAEQFAQEFEAMIDTGFTGFLQIPLTAAFPLALTLFGTLNYQLADGSVHPKLIGFGTVALEDESASGTMVLEANGTGLLVGMEFLAKLNKALFVMKDGVWLVDQGAFEKAMKSAADSATAEAMTTSTPHVPSSEAANSTNESPHQPGGEA